MIKKMSLMVFFLLILFVFTGCDSPQVIKENKILSDRSDVSMNKIADTSADSEDCLTSIICDSGVVRYMDMEGGFYGIITEKAKYLPLNLADEFKIDGLSVKFSAVVLENMPTIYMWGVPIRILKITAIPELPVKFETYMQGMNSGVEDKKNLVINDYKQLWALVYEIIGDSKQPIKNVDLEKYTVLASCWGREKGAAYALDIVRINRVFDIIQVYYTIRIIPTFAPVESSSPYHLVTIDKISDKTKVDFILVKQ